MYSIAYVYFFCVCKWKLADAYPVEWIRFFLHNPQNPLLRRSANGVQFMLADSVELADIFSQFRFIRIIRDTQIAGMVCGIGYVFNHN